jgi:hypothetical protein
MSGGEITARTVAHCTDMVMMVKSRASEAALTDSRLALSYGLGRRLTTVAHPRRAQRH